MKNKVLTAVAALLVFGLAIVAYSYSTAPFSEKAAMSCCCCNGESCPMKKKDASGKEVAMSPENCDCCGDSCPMMKKDANGNPVKMEGMSCCGDSCPMMKDGKHADMKDGANCPMMKEDAATATDVKNDKMHDMKGMHGDMKGMHGEGCTCPCCHAKDKNKDAKAVAPMG